MAGNVLNIRGVDPVLIRELKAQAAEDGVTLRELVIHRLRWSTGQPGESVGSVPLAAPGSVASPEEW